MEITKERALKLIEQDFAQAQRRACRGQYDVIALQGAANTASLAGIPWFGTEYTIRERAIENRAEMTSLLLEFRKQEKGFRRGEWIDAVQAFKDLQVDLAAALKTADLMLSKYNEYELKNKGYANCRKSVEMALERLPGLINEARGKAAREHTESLRWVKQLNAAVPSRFILINGDLNMKLINKMGGRVLPPDPSLVPVKCGNRVPARVG